jgi:hypothetical protein
MVLAFLFWWLTWPSEKVDVWGAVATEILISGLVFGTNYTYSLRGRAFDFHRQELYALRHVSAT